MKVYLAGPMTGIEDWNFPAFIEGAQRLRDAGHDVISPAEHDLELGYVEFTQGDGIAVPDHYDITDSFDREVVLAWDCEQIRDWADAVVLLVGWGRSEGVKRELQTAWDAGLPAFEIDDFMRGWMGINVCRELFGEHEVPHEERVVNETTGGEKGRKLARFDLLPAGPLHQVAEHFGRGAAKYEDRNWERGYDWSLSFGALQRHAWAFWNGEDVDEETGSHHMAAVAFHALALLEFAERHTDLDDRPSTAQQAEANRLSIEAAINRTAA